MEDVEEVVLVAGERDGAGRGREAVLLLRLPQQLQERRVGEVRQTHHEPPPVAPTHTATWPAGTVASPLFLPEREEAARAAAVRERDRHRRTARRRQTSDGIVMATLHMVA